MVQLNFAKREVNCKLVYYGPGMSGKTTNLEQVHKLAPQGSRGNMTSIATDGDRTLFFDFLPLDLGEVAGMRTKFQLYTVPGQVYYNATRKLVLQGADGVVFVADSQREKLQENIESLQNLIENLKEQHIDTATIPLVIQWNKRDMPSAMPIEEMEAKINTFHYPTTTGVAFKGEGVLQTLKLASKMVLERLNKEYGGKGQARPAATATTAVPVQQTTPAVPATTPAEPAKATVPVALPAPPEPQKQETKPAPKPEPVATPAAPKPAQQEPAQKAPASGPDKSKKKGCGSSVILCAALLITAVVLVTVFS
jgi:signal recognition particle receptor subunit beta